jgi:hypothetical protein
MSLFALGHPALPFTVTVPRSSSLEKARAPFCTVCGNTQARVAPALNQLALN